MVVYLWVKVVGLNEVLIIFLAYLSSNLLYIIAQLLKLRLLSVHLWTYSKEWRDRKLWLCCLSLTYLLGLSWTQKYLLGFYIFDIPLINNDILRCWVGKHVVASLKMMTTIKLLPNRSHVFILTILLSEEIVVNFFGYVSLVILLSVRNVNSSNINTNDHMCQ